MPSEPENNTNVKHDLHVKTQDANDHQAVDIRKDNDGNIAKSCCYNYWISRKGLWIVYLILWFVIGCLILQSHPLHKKKMVGNVSFIEQLIDNLFWWGNKNNRAKLCQEKTHRLQKNEAKAKSNFTTNATYSINKNFIVYEMTGVDYTLQFDKFGSKLLLWIISMIADVGVLYYHITNPPHPKFLLTKKRSISITMHALSGASECLTGLWVVFLVAEQRVAMIWYMSFFAIIHVLTAALQTEMVFGAKQVMVPCYLVAIFFKLLCWYFLVVHMMYQSEDIIVLSWFLSLELIHHIYVWVSST